MRNLSRRTFFGVSVIGLAALHSEGKALAALQSDAAGLPHRMNVDGSNASNLKLFLQNKETLGLIGVVSMTPVQGKLGRYASATMFLFPFKRRASDADVHAVLPGCSAARPPIPTVAMTPGGLPPDEYFCNYVLEAPWQRFISFSVDAPFARGAEKRPWHTNVDNIGDGSVGIGWTSSNLNHLWFAGSRWIPADDGGNGRYWRTRIIDGLRQASAMGLSIFAGRSVGKA